MIKIWKQCWRGTDVTQLDKITTKHNLLSYAMGKFEEYDYDS